jgi:FtsP/CotA-like multicopper oxidase with cupredoxin domain
MFLMKHNWSALARNAWANRQELVAAGLTSRRDLMKLGLLTSTGMLIAKHGLSSRVANAGEIKSPNTRAFVDPLPIPIPLRPLAMGVNSLNPPPSIYPNNAAGEGRTRPHQAFLNYPTKFPSNGTLPLPKKVFELEQKLALAYVSPDLPTQRLWGYGGRVPGPVIFGKYGEDMLIRHRNKLPAANGGFGINRVSTHVHNGHHPSESDGFPCDYYPNPDKPEIANANYHDSHYPNVLPGFSGAFAPDGDIRESLSSLWYHDHMEGFTAQNTYKGLAGTFVLFNEFDTGDETKGFRLPGVRNPNDFYAPIQYDVPLAIADRVFNPSTGQLYFDLFEQDGILGDKFLVNGKIQPFYNVKPRRYRFRLYNLGPSRFYELFLTDLSTNTSIPFWQIANDGNLLPMPIKVTSIGASVAERSDIVIDFKTWKGKTLYLENRCRQTDGRGADANRGSATYLLPPGQGQLILQFKVETGNVVDNSIDFETNPNVRFYELPPIEASPNVVRNFRFERGNGLWVVNGKPFDFNGDVAPTFRVNVNNAERWSFQNNSGGWMHPIHVHFEEFRMSKRNGVVIGPGNVEYSRKDVLRLQHGEICTVNYRFRDFTGRYPIHCHNTLHEDHAMMMRFDVVGDGSGDQIYEPGVSV